MYSQVNGQRFCVCVVDVDELKIMRNLPTGALDPGSLGRARVSSSPPSRLANTYAKEKFLYIQYQDLPLGK